MNINGSLVSLVTRTTHVTLCPLTHRTSSKHYLERSMLNFRDRSNDGESLCQSGIWYIVSKKSQQRIDKAIVLWKYRNVFTYQTNETLLVLLEKRNKNFLLLIFPLNLSINNYFSNQSFPRQNYCSLYSMVNHSLDKAMWDSQI